MAMYNPLKGCEPKQLDNFAYSAAIFQDESVDIGTVVLVRCGTRR